MKRSIGRRCARAYLSVCGCHHVEEALRDVTDSTRQRRSEGAGNLRARLWALRQILTIGLYELRDWRHRPRGLRPGLALLLTLRSVRRNPGVPLLAALTLGLGFGAAAAIYGSYAGFSRPLPVPDGAEIRWVRVLDERGRNVSVDTEDFRVVREASQSFAELGALITGSSNVRAARGYPVRVQSAAMTAQVFELLRLPPQLGRLPSADDESDAVLISDELWRDHFAADRNIVGSEVQIDGTTHVIVGVMPPGHQFPFGQDLWTRLDPAASTDRIELVGRLDPAASRTIAAEEITSILEGRRTAADESALDLRVDVPRFTENRGEGGEKMILTTLLALVISLVLVSCSNVSNLLLGRALARADLLAVHAAIGAGPAQVFLQLLVEALVISLAGAAVGLGLAAIAIDYIQSTLSGHWGYYWMRVQFEPAVVLFTLGLAVVAGTLSGLLPAFRLRGADLSEVLRSDASAVVGGSRGRLSVILLNAQVMVSALALIIAILIGGALLRTRAAADLRADDVYLLSVALDGSRYEQPEDRRAFRGALRSGLNSNSEVGEMVFANVVPGLENSVDRLEIDGVERDPDTRPPRVPVIMVDDGYFDLFGMRTVAGTGLPGAASTSEELVAVVSSSFVNVHLKGRAPLGQRIRLAATAGEQWIRIVGVVSDLVVYRDNSARAHARVYLPFGAVEPANFHLLFTGPEMATATMLTAIAEIDPDLGVTGSFGGNKNARVRDLVNYIGRIYQTGGVLAMLGGTSTALVALIGLYGALAFEVQRRMAEIGVRKALGADQRAVLRFVTRTGLRAVAPGLVVGFIMSAGFSPLLGVMLGRMNPLDPLVYMGVFLAFVAVAAAATLIPGVRAARVDPATVLRAD